MDLPITDETPAVDSGFASRKFILVCVAFAVFTGLLLVGKVDQATYQLLAMFALGGYLAANVAQKATAK